MASFNTTFTEAVSPNQKPQERLGDSSFIARVTHVVQGPYYVNTNVRDPYYQNPTDLGKVTFQLIAGTQDRTQASQGNVTAIPLYAALKQYPIEGELVYISTGPGTGLNDARGQRQFYYTLPYNLWNASHHNALPDLGNYTAYVNKNKRNYESTVALNQPTNTSATGSLVYPLGPDFAEKSNIKSLRQFTGDVTIEGRWGNSIRFGSTTADKKVNYWSSTGTVGDPIVIIRNGQGAQLDNTAWVPTVENINRDPSSIYLTQGQQITIDDLKNFSLTSLQVNINTETTVSIPIQQQLFAIDNLSPAEQDARAAKIANPNSNV